MRVRHALWYLCCHVEKLNSSKRTERGEREREPSGIPGPALVWLFNSSFTSGFVFYILKKQNRTKKKKTTTKKQNKNKNSFSYPGRTGFMSLATEFPT